MIKGNEKQLPSSITRSLICILLLQIFACTFVQASTGPKPANSNNAGAGEISASNIGSSSIAKRFKITGPVLTITLKDPFAVDISPKFNLPSQLSPKESEDSSPPAKKTGYLKWFTEGGSSAADVFGLSSLSPSLQWSVRSIAPPLPFYFPQLRSTALSVGYRYEDLKRRPSFYEGNFNLQSNNLGITLDVSPAYEVKKRKSSAVVRIGGSSTGNWFGLAKVGSIMGTGKALEFVRGFYKFNLPFSSMSSFSIAPTFDCVKNAPSCNLVGTTASGRSAGILDLNLDNPRLIFKHALDERNTISPEISFKNAKVMYNWDVALNSGSIKTRVDPLSAIQVTWTDQTPSGKWVTDFRLPLTSGPGPLAGEIRVRRQFIF